MTGQVSEIPITCSLQPNSHKIRQRNMHKLMLISLQHFRENTAAFLSREVIRYVMCSTVRSTCEVLGGPLPDLHHSLLMDTSDR